ncbi:MAG TPA: pseudouridine synthase [Mucilaginibacter sp.]|nr:pseudouridine synthase [Mucilaginibacter sp.]
MVFKKPGNSRDDRSSGAPKRNSRGDGQAKRTGNSRYAKSSFSGDKPQGDKPRRNYRDSPDNNRDRGDEKKSFSTGRKPYSGRPESDDRPKRSGGYRDRGDNGPGDRKFSGERKSYGAKKSYGDRPGPGEKRSYTKRPAPYSGRPTSDERPKRDFGDSERKTYIKRETPYTGRSTYDERPKRSDSDVNDHGSSGEKKFSRDGYKSGDRNSDSYRGGERGGFKKRDDQRSTPFRKSENSSYNKPKPDRSPEERVMRSRKRVAEKEDTGLIRLNRYISNAGICSRRKADELIAAGVISVNGEVVSELGYKVDPAKDMIRYNGETLKREKMVYVLLNKPKDYITTTDDPQERRTVMQLVEKASKERIYPVGRLDRNTTGLLLLTNDGDLADKLSHPKNNITKLYQVELDKSLTQGDLNKIAFGVELEDGLIKPDMISYVSGGTKRDIGIQIHSGRNRIVRRIFEHLGYEVVKLDRSVYAGLTKKDLPRGRWRYLDEKEIIQLKHLV